MPQFIKQSLPVMQLEDGVVLTEKLAQATLVEGIEVQRRWRVLQLLLNCFWQLQQIHDLCDAGARKPFPFGNAGFRQLGISRKLLLPAQCQLKRVWRRI